jgi:hypothetical protein
MFNDQMIGHLHVVQEGLVRQFSIRPVYVTRSQVVIMNDAVFKKWQKLDVILFSGPLDVSSDLLLLPLTTSTTLRAVTSSSFNENLHRSMKTFEKLISSMTRMKVMIEIKKAAAV